MVERKSGPVKPPILDLEARKAASAKDKETKTEPAKKPAPKPAAKKPEPKAEKPSSTEDQKPTPSKASFPILAVISATLLGSVGGAAIAFGIATSGLWPTPQPDMPINPNRVTTLETQVTELTNANAELLETLNELNQRIAATSAEQAANTITPDTLENMQAQISGLAEQLASQEPADLSEITTQLGALETQMSALASGTSSEDATELVKSFEETRNTIVATQSDFSALNENVSALTTRLAEIEAKVEAETTSTQTLAAELEALAEQAAAQPPQDLGTQVPLALSGFEAAILTGRSFANELSALQSALPDLTVPQSVADSAATGLPSPQEIGSALNAVIPDMLLAKPTAAGGNWQDDLRNRVTALLALRPTGDVAGDTPEAAIARLENAINQRDFTAARSALAMLPDQMQAAAGAIPSQISALSDAQDFADAARTAALQPTTPETSEATP